MQGLAESLMKGREALRFGREYCSIVLTREIKYKQEKEGALGKCEQRRQN